MLTITLAQSLHLHNFVGVDRHDVDLCIIEVTPQAAQAVLALADVRRITVPLLAAGVIPTGIVVRDPDERLGRVRLIKAAEVPMLQKALDGLRMPYGTIAMDGVFLTGRTESWRIEDAEITIVAVDEETVIRWSGLIEDEEYNIEVEFAVDFFAQVADRR